MRMALTGRHERLSAPRAYELGILSQVVDPPERLRDEAQALGEKIAQELARRDARDEARAVGRARARAHRRVPRRRSELVAMWGHPDQEEAAAFVERREPQAPLEPRKATVNYSTFERLIVERRGPVGWLINNRPDQLNAMIGADARRVRGRVEGARRRPRRAGDRAHRRRAARSRPVSTSPRSRPTASACSATSESVDELRPPLHARGTSRCGSRSSPR